MRRRSFLKTVATVVPAAGLQGFLASEMRAEPNASTTSPTLHVVGAGDDRFGQHHSMGVSTLLFKVGAAETDGRLFVIEHQHLVPGGPALHLHLSQEEWFCVMEGEVAFQVGDQRLHLRAGESILAPRRVPHTFSSVSATPSRMLIAFCPAGQMEQYFRDGEAAGAHAGDADFMRRYGMERVGPSPFWKT